MRNITPQEKARWKRWNRYKEEVSHEVCEANEVPEDTLENETRIEDFIIVAKALLFTAGHLSAPARFLYFVLFCHDWEPSERKRVCWPGGRRLAILMRCGRTQLSGYLNELRATELLMSKAKPNKPTRYKLRDIPKTWERETRQILAGEVPCPPRPKRLGRPTQKNMKP